jgi:predicted permease
MSVPLRPNMLKLEIEAENRLPASGEPIPVAEYRAGTPRFFDAAGMRVVSGRSFEETDQADSQPVVIVNEALAERLFGDEDPIGRRITWTGEVLSAIGMQREWRTIVGVVNNTLDDGPNMPAPAVVFHPLAQNPLGWFPGAFVIRGAGAPALAPRVQRILNEMAPDQPVLRVATLEEIRRETIASERLNTFLVGVLGALALAIATLGLVGVLSFFINERTTEIGIRMSLGADKRRILAMVLGDGARLLMGGIALGLLGSFGVARLLDGMLYGVAPGDPGTLALVVLVMTAVGLGASALPAMRAARIDPLVAIRRGG